LVPTVTTGPTAIFGASYDFRASVSTSIIASGASVKKSFGRLCQLFLITHFELLTLEFIDGIDGIEGKVAPPPTIPSMFLCKFASDEHQILRWLRRLRWWILTLTNATNADSCTFALLLRSDVATVATVQPGSYRRYRRYFARSLRSVVLNSLVSIESVQACTRSGGHTLPLPMSATLQVRMSLLPRSLPRG
jgi:hypothetical protein